MRATDAEIVVVRGWNTTPEPDGIAVNRDHAAEVLPFRATLPPRVWAGLMPLTLDDKPLIGRVPGRDGLWIVGGLASGGGEGKR